jgi:hypothetical protein
MMAETVASTGAVRIETQDIKSVDPVVKRGIDLMQFPVEITARDLVLSKKREQYPKGAVAITGHHTIMLPLVPHIEMPVVFLDCLGKSINDAH